MTLRELKGVLNALPDEFNDVEVAMSKDAEGNRYSPCVYVVTDGYCDDSSKYDIDQIYFDHHGILTIMDMQETALRVKKNGRITKRSLRD